MNRTRLLWRVASPYLILTLLAVAAIGWYSARTIREFYVSHIREDLELQAHILLESLPSTFPATNLDSLQQFCATQNKLALARITLIARDGRVLGDSDADPRTMENHSLHPEVRSALGGQPRFDIRFSVTLHREMVYFALPVRQDSQIVGVVRTALPLTTLEATLRGLLRSMLIGAVIVALIAALLTIYLTRRFSRPIIEMARGAEKFAAGDFSRRLDLPPAAELATLAESLNHMAAELDERIRELTSQRNEQEAILASLREGVIALDLNERILFVSRAAAEILHVDPAHTQGRLLQECVRISDLQRFARALLEGPAISGENEATFEAGLNRTLQARGTALRNAVGSRVGVVIVLSDVTHLRRLETVRRDFVANVSHELKTPITSILGFVETLRDSALDDSTQAHEFLERIHRNTERLSAIVEDLLSLSRIEQESEQGQIERTPLDLRDCVQTALAAVASVAREHQVNLVLENGDDVRAEVNSTLLEQAIINLLDNAVKYSEAGQSVEVTLTRDSAHAAIRVRDHGVGIARDQQERIFERFYRVDKSRSRVLGGTGLGLSIVKHIVQAHGGSVGVESMPGEGSTFTIALPLS